MARRSILRRAGKWAGFTLLGLGGFVVVGFGVLQTGPGKAGLARIASSLASQQGLDVKVEGITGLVPFDLRIARISAADAKGTFAAVDDLAFAFNALPLLRGAVDIRHVTAARVDLARLPDLPPAEAPPPAKSSGGGIPMVPVRLGHLEITDLLIGAPVMGHDAHLSVTASADLMAATSGLAADFDVARRDAPGEVRGKLSYVPSTRVLQVDVSASEPEGGLVATAAGIEGLPPVSARIAGNGPIDAWDGTLALAAGSAAKADGTVTVRAVPNGHRVAATIDADVAKLLPANVAPLFEHRSALNGTVVVTPAGPIDIEAFSVRTVGFGVAGKGVLDPSGPGSDLVFDVTAGPAQRFSGLAPGVAWRALTASGTLKGALDKPAATLRLDGRDLAGAGYKAGSLILNAHTTAEARRLLIAAEGTAEGLSADDAKVAKALGSTARFSLAAQRPDNADPVLTGATISLAPLDARFTGLAGPSQADGTLHLEKLDLAAFAPLAGRPLAGTVKMDVAVKGTDAFKTLALTLSGAAEGIKAGIAPVDSIFGATTRLGGTITRDGANALAVKDLTVKATGLDVAVDGRLSRDLADLKAKVSLDNLKRVDERLTGALDATAAFSGRLDALGVDARISVPRGTAMGQPVEGLALGVKARDLTGLPSGDFRLDGRIAGKTAAGGGSFALGEGGAAKLDGLDVAIGSVTAKGAVARAADGLLSGRLAVAAANLADLSALALTELAGRLDADLAFDSEGGAQAVAVKASADNVKAAGNVIQSARIDARVVDPAGSLTVNGTVNLSGVNASGVAIPRFALTARAAGDATQFNMDGEVNGAALTGAGRLSHGSGAQGATHVVRLDRLNVSRSGTSVATSAPATITLSGGDVTIDRLALASGGGSVIVAGRAGQSLDLSVDLRSLPLALAELAAPGLGLSGTASGSARLRGAAAAPDGTYDLSIARLTTPDVARSGAGPFDIRAQGDFRGGRVTTRTTVSGPNLSGLSITGSAPMGAGDLDLAIRGNVDLRIANATLAASGSQMSGTAAIDATVRGTPAAPRAGGTVRISGGRFNDAVNGISLDRMEGVITGTERSVTVSSFSARTPNGGGLTATGNVALDPAGHFPGRIEVNLQNAGLVNSELMRLVAGGRIAVEGRFLDGPRVTGRIEVNAMDVNIAERMPGGVQQLPVRHVNDRRGANAARARQPAQARGQGQAASRGMDLDITVSAPNNIFVRGMGMTAELGGNIKVTGTSASPVTQGAFEMRRGRFDVLGKTLDFTRGKITFTGTPDPELDFVAETTANEITARILVTGPASKPEISFTSTPTLPQDEVLARLMFNRSSGSLTPGQALQLAQTIAQFSGRGNAAMNQMRRALGADSLDLGTNAAGTGGQVGLGKRINDRIYMGVRQGTTPGSSQVTIDVDVTRNIRLQGATGADGSTSVGVGAQWDY